MNPLILIAGVLAFLGFSKKDEILEKVDDLKTKASGNWTKYDALFQSYGKKYGVNWQWLKAIAMNESSLGQVRSVALGLLEPSNIEASKSSDGKSWGLMQVTLKTAWTMDARATAEKLNNPEYSINLAAQYVGKLQEMFKKPQYADRFREWVIKSYNQGPGNTLKEIRGETKGYAAEYWARFQRNLERVING